MLASLLSVLTFDFFLVEPRLSFTVADSQYLLTFLGLLMVGLVISNSAALLRDQVQALRSREAHLDALNSLSRELTRAVNLEEMLQSVVAHVEKGIQPSGGDLAAREKWAAAGCHLAGADPGARRSGCGATGLSPATPHRRRHRHPARYGFVLPAARDGAGQCGGDRNWQTGQNTKASRPSSGSCWMVLLHWPRWPSNGRAWLSKPARPRSWRTPSACRRPCSTPFLMSCERLWYRSPAR